MGCVYAMGVKTDEQRQHQLTAVMEHRNRTTGQLASYRAYQRDRRDAWNGPHLQFRVSTTYFCYSAILLLPVTQTIAVSSSTRISGGIVRRLGKSHTKWSICILTLGSNILYVSIAGSP